jgi:hypothetical protein
MSARQNARRRMAHLVLLLYLSGAVVFFVRVAQPVLRGDLDFQFYADSATYVKMAEEDAPLQDLLQVGLNALGPVLLLRALHSDPVLVFVFNVAAFLAAYRILRSSSAAADPLYLALALAASPVMFSSLMSINKEILALLVISLLAAHHSTGRRSYFVAGLLLSPLIRWQLTVFALVSAALRSGPLRRHRALALGGLVIACSIGYPLMRAGVFQQLDDIAQAGALEQIGGSGLYARFVALQNRGLYFLVVVPKVLHLFVGLISRVGQMLQPTDVYNNLVATSQAIANLAISALALLLWRIGRLRLDSHPFFLGLVFAVIFGLSPIYSPRYLFPVYVLLALSVAESASDPVSAWPDPTPSSESRSA